MNHTAFFEELKKGSLASCYLLEGEEEYIKRQAYKQLCEKVLPAGLEELNRTDLVNPDADSLIMACETLPMMSEKRLVTVRDYAPLLPPKRGAKEEPEEAKEKEGKIKAVDPIPDYLSALPSTVCLVFYVKGEAGRQRRLYTAIDKRGGVVTFNRLSEGECVRWLSQQARRQGKMLSADVAQALIFTVGGDASLLQLELDKLCRYVGDAERITEEDIGQICTRSTECTVFQMVDAQTEGRFERAMTLLGHLLENGEERMMVLAMLLRQYRILYHIRRMNDEKTPGGEQAALIGIPPFAYKRAYPQAMKYSAERLYQAYQALLGMEEGIKRGELSQNACAENAMMLLEGILRPENEQSRRK